MAKKLKLEHDESEGYNYFQNLADNLVLSIFTKLNSSSSHEKHECHVDSKALGRCTMVCKRFNALVDPVLGKTCFEKLPDALVIRIFTKLSSTSDEKYDSLGDLEALGRCSSISKRFNSLVSLVPSLSIKHPSIVRLCLYFPLILKTFKHIRSLEIRHWYSTTAALMRDRNERSPLIVWEASYRPHSYWLAVVSYKNISSYISKDPQTLMLSDATPKDDEYHESIWRDIKAMFLLHHILVSSIKDHTFLQRVVVTDLHQRGTLTLEEDMLAELRNCATTNLEHVLVRDRSGSAINLDFPGPYKCLGIMLNEVCFSVLEYSSEKPMPMPMHDHNPIPKDEEDVTGIPTDLQKPWLVELLGVLLKDPAMVEVNDSTDVIQLLSDLKSAGYLI